jgi:hypothetical protein
LFEKLSLMRKILSVYKIKKTIIFIFLSTLAAANFEVFIGYSNEEIYHISSAYEGGMMTIIFVVSTFLLISYNSFLGGIRMRYFCVVGNLARYFGILVFSGMVKSDKTTS